MSGIFDAIPTAAERQKAVLQRALQARRSAWAHADKGYLYLGGGDLLLRHGQFFSGEELPSQYAQYYGAEGRCFENTLDACEADPTIRYYEGVYAIGSGHYTPHAWGVTPDGHLLEFTMPTDPEMIALGLEHRTKLPMLSVESWGYWGVEFNATFVRAYWDSHQEGHVGILDRPSQDGAEKENTAEWRDHWPIFTYRYEAGRTKP